MGMSDRTTNAVGLYDAAINLRSRFIAETNAFLARYWNDPLARVPMKAPGRPAAPTVAAEPLVVRLMEAVEVIPPPGDVVVARSFSHLVFAHAGETQRPEVDVAPVDAPSRHVTVVTSHELGGDSSQAHEPGAAGAAHPPPIARRAASAVHSDSRRA
jgi:hypothetical protein